jgi:hypothetical protein
MRFPLSNEVMERVFRPRGISRKVAEARPYISFAQGDGADVFEAEEALDLPEEARWVGLDKRGRRNFAALRKRTTRDSGLYMVRHAIPEVRTDQWPNSAEGWGSPIVAELRPDHGVRLNDDDHRHDDGTRLIPRHGPKRETREGWERERAANARRLAEAKHVLREVEAGHINPRSALAAGAESYVAEPPSLPDRRTDEQRAEASLRKTQRHIAASHPGGNPKGWHLADPDPTKYQHKAGLGASRLEMHPWAHDLLLKYHRDRDFYVVFAMEGVLKADAALTYILKHELCATVVDIPSVWNWKRERLPLSEVKRFTELYLQGVHVKVVCDSDWDPDGQRRQQTDDPFTVYDAIVGSAAKPGLTKVLRYWGADAMALAPTDSSSRKACKHYIPRYQCVECRKRGLDDYLADGGTFDGLVPVARRQLGGRPLFLAGRNTEEHLATLLAYYRTVCTPGVPRVLRYKDMGEEAQRDPKTFARLTETLAGLGHLEVETAKDERGHKVGIRVTLK